ncbi:MAG: rod-binding protein [Treponema sp.]|jgi:flagellar protein FlgJ|nr:rod-binding protein [Treponema sp.]
MAAINPVSAGVIPLQGNSSRGREVIGDARGGFDDIVTRFRNKSAQVNSGANEAGTKAVIDKNSELYEQCEALETFLVKNMLSGMRKTVIKSKLVDTGFSGEVYEDMLWDEYAKEYTKKTDFGLAELAYLELTRQRGKIPPSELG